MVDDIDQAAQIVEGPTPDEYGNAIFVVQIGERRVTVHSDPFGVGVREADFDVSGPSMRAVFAYRVSEPVSHDRCLREAARLRRAAGHPPMFNVVVPSWVVVAREPRMHAGVPRFAVQIRGTSLEILVRPDGALADNHEPDGSLEVADLEAAYRAVLDHIFSNPLRAPAWGLDVETLRLFWT